MDQDPELKAMNSVYEIFKNLDEEIRLRIVNWLVSKFSINRPKSMPTCSASTKLSESEDGSNSITTFVALADLFGKAAFKTDADKVLLVASYLQLKENKEDLTGWEINKELKHLGHPVSNITATINLMRNRKPSLMVQTHKAGKSQQAKKKYNVTMEGIKAAESMISIT